MSKCLLQSYIGLSPRRFRLLKKFGEVTKVTLVTLSTYAYRWLRLPFQPVTVKHNKSWLFQLAIGTKIKVSEVVMECLIELNGVLNKANLNFLPLGSYDAFIGMDWLEKDRDKVECYEKVLE